MDNSCLPALRKRIAKAPTGPGIYRWKDAKGTVLYVGKAVNLRERLRSYVAVAVDKAIGPWKSALRRHLSDVEWTVTNSDLEALILETNLIKQLRPKYNVMMKDDKNYVYLEVTTDPCPSLDVVRQMENPKAKYFGPYLSAWEVRRALEVLQMLLHFQACKRGIDRCNRKEKDSSRFMVPGSENQEPGTANLLKPCLEYQIGKCNGLCIEEITPEEYRDRIAAVTDFFKGNRAPLAAKAKELMADAAAQKKYERAGKLRDALSFIEHQKEGQIVSDPMGTNIDVIGIGLSAAHAVAVVLKVRDGKLIAEEMYPLKGEPEDAAEALGAFLPQYTESQTELPATIVVGEDFPDRHLLEAWCTQKMGRKVSIVIPERGRRSHLLILAEKNAQEKLKAQETAWETAAKNVQDALTQLQSILQLPVLPKRIEGYDISHLGGTETVGSMVVMINGKPANDEYRSFTLRTVKEGEVDDYKALREVLRRRLLHLTRNLEREKESWTRKEISFGKARKTEQKEIEGIMQINADVLSNDNLNYKQFTVARKNNKIIGCARLFENPGGVLEIKSVWVTPEERGQKLGQFVIRKILANKKRDKVYVTFDPQLDLEQYYSDIGFRHLQTPPKILQEKTEQFCREHPSAKPGTIMMYIAKEHRADPSLESRPDLLVIDGGKGQLSSALEALRAAGIDIPTIGLAKKQEEVFVPGKSDPVIFPQDAPAKFLLMRLRDEAHRFSNRHREKRLKHRAVASALDDVPGIGPKTKSELLKKFGSLQGIQSAQDDELLAVLNETQLKALREAL